MSRPGDTRRATVTLGSGPGRLTVPMIGSRSLHQYWALLMPHFRGILLPPQSRSDDAGTQWSWREPLESASLNAAEFATVRKRLASAQLSLAASAEVASESVDPRRAVAILPQVQARMSEVVASLAAKPDAELAPYVVRSERGLMLHSWGLAAALKPYYPDALDCEISGTVLVANEPGPDQQILLESADGNVLARTRSDAMGNFRFPRISSGHYRVRAASDRVVFPPEGVAVDIEHVSVTGVKLRANADDRDAAVAATKSNSASTSRRRLQFSLIALLAFAVAGSAWWWTSARHPQTPRLTSSDNTISTPTAAFSTHPGNPTSGSASTTTSSSTLTAGEHNASGVSATRPLPSLGYPLRNSAQRLALPLPADLRAIELGAKQSGPSATNSPASPADPAAAGPSSAIKPSAADGEPSSTTAGASPAASIVAGFGSSTSHFTPPVATPVSAEPHSTTAASPPGLAATPPGASANTTPSAPPVPTEPAKSASHSVPATASAHSGTNAIASAPATNADPSLATNAEPDSPTGKVAAISATFDRDGVAPAAAGAIPADNASVANVTNFAAASGPIANLSSATISTPAPTTSSANPSRASTNPSVTPHASPSATSGDAAPSPASATAGSADPAPDALPAVNAAPASANAPAPATTDDPTPARAAARNSPEEKLLSSDASDTAPTNRSPDRMKRISQTKTAANTTAPEEPPLPPSPVIEPIDGIRAPQLTGAVGVSDPRRVRFRATPWQLRLLQDTILPTQPTRLDEDDTVDAMRERLFRERQLQIPPQLKNAAAQCGFAIEFSAATTGPASAHWRAATGQIPSGATVLGTRAEFSWSVAAKSNLDCTLLDDDGRELAHITGDPRSGVTLLTAAGVNGWTWIGIEHTPADNTRFTAAQWPARLDWQVLNGPPALPTWRSDDHWLANRGHRLDLIAGDRESGLIVRTVALVDQATGWSIVTDLELVRESPSRKDP
jgi:hypothetical protein